MIKRSRFGLVAVALGSAAPAGAANAWPADRASAPMAAWTGALSEASCTDVPRWAELSAPQRARVRCGRLRVPLDHAKPRGGTITLAVAVRRAEPAIRRSPLMILNGGVSGSLSLLATSFAPPYPADRDVVLIDPRGMDGSTMALCRTTTREKIAAMARDLAGEALRRAYHAPLATCRAEMRAAGVPPHVFGAVAIARDIEIARRALGYDRLVMVGQSFGTTLAPTYAALFPTRVEAMVLDSTYPADPTPKTLTESFREGLAGAALWCRGRPICGPAREALLESFDAARAALGREPLRLTTATFGDFILNDDDFDLITQYLLYPGVQRAIAPDVSPYPLAPALIAAVQARDAPLAARIADEALSRLARGPNSAVFTSGECRDRPRYRRPPPAFTGVELIDFSTVCSWWTDAPVEPVRWPTEAAIPTLVLYGSVDPITPVSFGREMSRRLGASARQLIAPGWGHGVRSSSPCARAATLAFLSEPRLDRIPATCPD